MRLLLTSDDGEYTPSVLSLIRMSTRPNSSRSQQHARRRRNHTGIPDADTEVVALSPNTLMATNRFVCEICNKGFQRDQNLQLHRRGHNLPWKLRRATGKQRRRVYVCPEASCEHHHPSMALGDLTGIKKHFSRKHCEKNLKCEKCGKLYAVFSDWKAHSKTCGTREYRCDCGTIFNRKDSFLTHRALCEAISLEKLMPSSSLLPPEFNFHVPSEAPAMFFNGIMISHSTDHDQLLNSSFNPISMAEILSSSSQFYNETMMSSSQMPANSLPVTAPQMGSFADGESSAQPFLGDLPSSSLKSEPCAGLENNSNEFGQFFGLDYKPPDVPLGGYQELMMMSNYEIPMDNQQIAPQATPPPPPQSSFLTRDFLGIGGDAMDSNTLLQLELDKFMSNARANLVNSSSSSLGGAAGDH